jgi:hypothetical protein
MDRWFEFTVDLPHPENDSICLRFVIEIPYFSAATVPDGARLETRIRWRERLNG